MRKCLTARVWLVASIGLALITTPAVYGEVVNGVPAYVWHNGCGPTAVGMVAGYYATHGFTKLVDGNASVQVKNMDYLNFHREDYDDPVNKMISSLDNYEACPVFAGKTKVIHVGFDDPPRLAANAKTESEHLAVYRRVRDEIRAFVEALPDALDQ